MLQSQRLLPSSQESGLVAFGESGLVGQGIVLRTGRFPVQTPVGAWPGLGTQPHYEAPGDPWVENAKRSD